MVLTPVHREESLILSGIRVTKVKETTRVRHKFGSSSKIAGPLAERIEWEKPGPHSRLAGLTVAVVPYIPSGN